MSIDTELKDVFNATYYNRMSYEEFDKAIESYVLQQVTKGKIEALNQAHRRKGIADVDNETDETIDEMVEELESELQALQGDKK